MKTYMKLLIMAALLAAFLVLPARSTTAVSPAGAGRAISAPGTYPLLIGATGDDHSDLLLSFAQGVALPPHDPVDWGHLTTGTAGPSQPAQSPGMPVTGSADTGSIILGLVGLALRLLIVAGLVLFFRSRMRTEGR